MSNVFDLSTIIHNAAKKSKNTLYNESSEELKRLMSKGYDINDNNDDGEKQRLPSSTVVVEPQSEIPMNRSDLTK